MSINNCINEVSNMEEKTGKLKKIFIKGYNYGN